jgi:hypothetical protein
MAIEYRIFDVVKTGTALIASRTPRIQPSAQRHFADHLSWMVSSDMWSIDPTSGEPISYKGKTIEQECEGWIEERPNVLEPVELTDTSGECWTEGNLSKQGERLRELERFTGNKKSALAALTAEAAEYGVKPGSTERGEKIDSKGDGKKAAGSSGNPWDQEHWRGGDETARQAAMLSIIRTSTERARTMAKSVNRKIDGRPL